MPREAQAMPHDTPEQIKAIIKEDAELGRLKSSSVYVTQALMLALRERGALTDDDLQAINEIWDCADDLNQAELTARSLALPPLPNG
jgi:uncharacterized membrane protein